MITRFFILKNLPRVGRPRALKLTSPKSKKKPLLKPLEEDPANPKLTFGKFFNDCNYNNDYTNNDLLLMIQWFFSLYYNDLE